MRKDPPDICRNKHGGNPESEAANISLSVGVKTMLKFEIETYIERQGMSGATCDEIEAALNIRHQTASARVSELKEEARIHQAPFRRKTRSGRSAAVYLSGPGESFGQLELL